MTATKGIRFENRFFWAYDVAAGVFLKYLIDEAEASGQTNAPWLSDAVTSWRREAAIAELGLTIKEEWLPSQRQTFMELAEKACEKLATRESIPAEEIISWPLQDELHIYPRTREAVFTAPVIELGRAIKALVAGNLPESPKGEAWFYGTPDGRSTIRMRD